MKTFQAEVFKRFLSEKEFTKLVDEYKKNRKRSRSYHPEPLTPKEEEVLFAYMDRKIGGKDVARELKVSRQRVCQIMQQCAYRYLYSQRSKMGEK